MQQKTVLAGKALILVSGPSNPKAGEIVRSALNDYRHEEIEVQRIDLGGRTILAALIALDPAHIDHIERDLISACSENELDVALELL